MFYKDPGITYSFYSGVSKEEAEELLSLMANQGTWHWSKFYSTSTSWTPDPHGDKKYTFSFVDGHSSLVQIIEQDTGISHSFDKLSFINKK